MIPEHIIVSYALKEGVTFLGAKEDFKQLERFFDSYCNNGIDTPSSSIDKAWHHFILHTQDYNEYCFFRYNIFLHHKPANINYQISNHEILVTVSSIDDCSCEGAR